MRKFLSLILILAMLVGMTACTLPWQKDSGKDAKPQIDAAATYTDVNKGDWFEESVSWGVSEEIMTPAKPTLFGVETPQTRADVILSMWKAAGSPGKKASAKGVESSDPQSDLSVALTWAVENELISKYQASFTTDVLNRQEVIDYMYSANGSPDVNAVNPAFSDVSVDNSSVSWAKDNNITYGVGQNLFAPDLACSKAMLITFLYRAK
ncbi:MAG: S-layer homology domain-containing protein [Firmicutes bacterium]|nr:S-layer homology domain-containing protein [Bacillota bacterium]